MPADPSVEILAHVRAPVCDILAPVTASELRVTPPVKELLEVFASVSILYVDIPRVSLTWSPPDCTILVVEI